MWRKKERGKQSTVIQCEALREFILNLANQAANNTSSLVVIFEEVQPSLVGGPVFKTGEGDEKSPWWVRFPCASAIHKMNL